MNTPNDLSDTQINSLVERNELPRKPEIDLRHAYDIQTEYDTSAPRNLAWSAIDANTYDPPLGGMFACIGRGPTPQVARFSLLEQLAEYK